MFYKCYFISSVDMVRRKAACEFIIFFSTFPQPNTTLNMTHTTEVMPTLIFVPKYSLGEKNLVTIASFVNHLLYAKHFTFNHLNDLMR